MKSGFVIGYAKSCMFLCFVFMYGAEYVLYMTKESRELTDVSTQAQKLCAFRKLFSLQKVVLESRRQDFQRVFFLGFSEFDVLLRRVFGDPFFSLSVCVCLCFRLQDILYVFSLSLSLLLCENTVIINNIQCWNNYTPPKIIQKEKENSS